MGPENKLTVYMDGSVHTITNENKCADCPVNPLRFYGDEDEGLYTDEDGQPIHPAKEN